MPRTARRTLPLCLASLLAAGPAAAQTIETGPPNAAPNLAPTAFGRAGTNSFLSMGQSFVVPVGGSTVLTSFQFWLRGETTPPGSVPYRAYVFAWDPATRRTGATALFRSEAQSFAGAATNTPVTFATGELNLAAGESYIAVLSSVEFADAPIGVRGGPVYTASWPASSYAGGAAFEVFSPNTGLAGPTSIAWREVGANGQGWDAAFVATFTPVSVIPEPTTVGLVAGGLLGVVVLRRRRRAA